MFDNQRDRKRKSPSAGSRPKCSTTKARARSGEHSAGSTVLVAGVQLSPLPLRLSMDGKLELEDRAVVELGHSDVESHILIMRLNLLSQGFLLKIGRPSL